MIEIVSESGAGTGIMNPKTWAVVVAAGKGSRAGFNLPKQFQRLGGRTVLQITIEAFSGYPDLQGIVVVIDPTFEQRVAEIVREAGKTLPFPIILSTGGSTRQASVRSGLETLADKKPDFVLIHDAARPELKRDLLSRMAFRLSSTAGVVPALPISDALKVTQRAPDGQVQITADAIRENFIRAQTPQGFPFQAILQAHRRSANRMPPAPDDVSIALENSIPVSVIEGDPLNIKLTTEQDFRRAAEKKYPRHTRVGNGFDVHAFDATRELILGGVRIPSSPGLKGHSDADVLLHAITDALLGLIGDGDIGVHFPPDDPQWKNAGSGQFLTFARDRIRRAGGHLRHVDCTILAESPKLSPFRDEIRGSIASLCEIKKFLISVKATTTEKLGFVGRSEGIACIATATADFPDE